ncbi:MAG: DUF4932 domain-containing protein [bacterium]|nr:DUF4932 domain-containing protein [bacterium]
MKKLMTSVLLLILCLPAFTQSKIEVKFNENLELLGMAYTVVYENPNNDRFDNTDPSWEYGKWLTTNYGNYGDSKTLQEILPKIEHLWINDFMGLLTSVDPFPNANLDNSNFSNFEILSPSGDAEEGKEIAESFLKAMNKFHKEVKFDEYLTKQKEYYDAAFKSVKVTAYQGDLIKSLSTLYKGTFETSSVLVSLTLPGGMGFAHTDGADKSVLLITSQSQQNLKEYNLGFQDTKAIRGLLIHEFGHNYIHEAFGKIPAGLFQETEYLNEPIADKMITQNYTNWNTVLNEHFTRASEVMSARIAGDTQLEQELLDYHINERSFIYLPTILTHIDQAYNNQSDMGTAFIDAIKALKAGPSQENEQQIKQLKGIVTTVKGDEPLPFVHIGIPGKNRGVISTIDGTFEINLENVEPSDSLVFSTIGFQRKAYLISDIATDDLNVTLDEEVFVLEEVKVTSKASKEVIKIGRAKPSKTTRGQNGLVDYGFGGEYGIRVNNPANGYLVQDINFHMRFNSTDSILFRINIYDIKDGLPQNSLLKKDIFLTSKKGKKWIVSADLSDRRLIIDQDIIVTYEVVRIYYSKKGQNNIFFTYGSGYEEGGMFVRNSSLDKWVAAAPDAFPITLYINGRIY